MGRGAHPLGATGRSGKRFVVSAHAAPAVADEAPSSRAIDDDVAIDIVFDIAVESLPDDARATVRDAVLAALPWLRDDPWAGIHPIASASDDGSAAPLSRRARLVLRVPEARRSDALSLAGRTLDVGGRSLRIRGARAKALVPFPTIGAHFVATMAADALAHERTVEAMLEAIAMPRRFVCGRLARFRAEGREIRGASVVVHDLSPSDSLRLQRVGLGPHRALGCGLFIAHKTISGLD